jgi:hypothetical protein
MKTTKLQKLIALAVIGLFAILIMPSCEEEEDLSVGFSEEIENFVPDSTIQLLRDLGMIIHEGKEPPSLVGKYYLTPNLMDSSNVPNESRQSGHRFADYRLHFHNQNNEKLSIELDTEGLNTSQSDTTIISSSIGNGGFLSGYDNEFSVFIISETESYHNNNQDTARIRMLRLYSGEIAPEGIKYFKSSLLVLDDYGDEFDVYIPINTGRIFHDGDSLAHRLSDSEWQTKYFHITTPENSALPSVVDDGR